MIYSVRSSNSPLVSEGSATSTLDRYACLGRLVSEAVFALSPIAIPAPIFQSRHALNLISLGIIVHGALQHVCLTVFAAGLAQIWPEYGVLVAVLSFCIMGCLSTAIQMARCDPRVHVLWVWLLLAASAPLMRGTWKAWTSLTLAASLAIVVILSHFHKRLPGQEWIKKLNSQVVRASPRPHPENYLLGFWQEFLLRLAVNLFTSGSLVLSDIQLGLAGLLIPTAAFFLTCFVASRFAEDRNERIAGFWWPVILWCTGWYCWNGYKDPETLIVLLNANLAHLLNLAHTMLFASLFQATKCAFVVAGKRSDPAASHICSLICLLSKATVWISMPVTVLEDWEWMTVMTDCSVYSEFSGA
ncbi:hypothetical protein PSACC_03511 [Paramicrosporidium saccamoebae]|uniref:Uncharacterized protein n=1 Tax=Paramicrosporidium saccamoebae TaxID=1246581 RepID=A0A2H9TGF7_9FUNG|nr:hypothetical protein PSACC_03511 [Paramicrosporidium saccamoebae]